MSHSLNRIGTDIVEVARVRASIERTGAHFLERVYTPQERVYCESRNGVRRFESYAARFAAKEAFAKALGTGIAGDVALSEIEVLHEESGACAGRPRIRLHGATQRYFTEHFPGCGVEVSLSHTAALALATVLITAG